MYLIDAAGKICALLMAGGTLLILVMLSRALYIGILTAADAVEAAVEHRERRNARILTDAGSLRLNGPARPLVFALVLSGLLIYYSPGKRSLLLAALICMWGAGGACFCSVRYCMDCSQQTALFIRIFHARFAACGDRTAAFEKTCAVLPEGPVRSMGIAACGKLAGGGSWSEAIRTLDDGTFCGKGLLVFLDLYGKTAAEPDEAAAGAFARAFEGLASQIRWRMDYLAKNMYILAGVMGVHSVCALFLTGRCEPGDTFCAVLLISMILAASAVLIRNMCLNGRLL